MVDSQKQNSEIAQGCGCLVMGVIAIWVIGSYMNCGQQGNAPVVQHEQQVFVGVGRTQAEADAAAQAAAGAMGSDYLHTGRLTQDQDDYDIHTGLYTSKVTAQK